MRLRRTALRVAGRPMGSSGPIFTDAPQRFLWLILVLCHQNVKTGGSGWWRRAMPTGPGVFDYRNQGMSRPYQCEVVGANLLMTDLPAASRSAAGAPGRHHRQPDTQRLRPSPRCSSRWRRRSHSPDAGRAFARVAPLHRDAAAGHRPPSRRRLRDDGVQTGTYCPAIVQGHPPYRDHRQVVIGDIPVAARARWSLSFDAHPRRL